MASIFTKIVEGKIPCYKVAETDDCLAFLDIFPLIKGHTLIIPKLEVDYYFDLEDDLMTKLNLFSKRIAKALKKAYPCERVAVMVLGLEVPHAHIHLVPMNDMSEVNFSNPKLQFSQDEFKAIAENIRTCL